APRRRRARRRAPASGTDPDPRAAPGRRRRAGRTPVGRHRRRGGIGGRPHARRAGTPPGPRAHPPPEPARTTRWDPPAPRGGPERCSQPARSQTLAALSVGGSTVGAMTAEAAGDVAAGARRMARLTAV